MRQWHDSLVAQVGLLYFQHLILMLQTNDSFSADQEISVRVSNDAERYLNENLRQTSGLSKSFLAKHRKRQQLKGYFFNSQRLWMVFARTNEKPRELHIRIITDHVLGFSPTTFNLSLLSNFSQVTQNKSPRYCRTVEKTVYLASRRAHSFSSFGNTIPTPIWSRMT